MKATEPCWFIRSVREDGQRFRPSDWIERISANMAQFGPDRRLRYDHSLQPRTIDGEKCLVVGGGLAARHPELYEHIMAFARSNQLQRVEGDCDAVIAA